MKDWPAESLRQFNELKEVWETETLDREDARFLGNVFLFNSYRELTAECWRRLRPEQRERAREIVRKYRERRGRERLTSFLNSAR